ncbi:MAG: hypothetical protein AAFV80_09745 [Bacteroidota bacterium]
MKAINAETAAAIYQQAVQAGQLGPDNHAWIFYVREVLDTYLNELSTSFPGDTLHAIAVKTNSSPEVLQHIVSRGFGLEAASIGEVELALEAGIDPSKLVFDSPVKTKAEIAFCAANCPGMLLNANSIQELERYPHDFRGTIGLRINPLINPDVPSIFNVSQRDSKFGVPVSNKVAIQQACLDYPVEALHLHIGSGASVFDTNVEAVKVVVTLAREINEQLTAIGTNRRIHTIDIGGGIEFSMDDLAQSAKAYVNALQATCRLFDEFNVVTEFGKFVHQHASFVVSDIEYVVPSIEPGGKDAVFLHVGADLFLRKVYSELPISFPWSIIRSGNLTEVEVKKYQIVGPLCFAGDVLYSEIETPVLTESDKFVLHDIGANTLSMWSRHCSRKKPRLILI